MVDMKRALCIAALTAGVAFAGSALADSKKQYAPGQGELGQNPSQTFRTQRDLGDPNPLPPGQELKLNPDAPPPGQGVINWGKTKP
jgi:hypothetical protein